jgi:pimeloyl-ACP methyl ester carboxylesterase
MAWPRRVTETLLNNYLTRRSFADRSLACTTRGAPGDWLRHRRGYPQWHRITRKLDHSGLLGEISVPTLVACGCHDSQYPPACSEQLATKIPSARLVFFDHSGHYPYIEEPTVFWEAMRIFWLLLATSGEPSCPAAGLLLICRISMAARYW